MKSTNVYFVIVMNLIIKNSPKSINFFFQKENVFQPVSHTSYTQYSTQSNDTINILNGIVGEMNQSLDTLFAAVIQLNPYCLARWEIT